MSSSPISIRYLSKKHDGVGVIISLLSPAFSTVNVRRITTVDEARKKPLPNILIIDTTAIDEETALASALSMDDTPIIVVTNRRDSAIAKKILKSCRANILGPEELKGNSFVNTAVNLIEYQKLSRQLKAARQQIREMAIKDELTQLYNSRFLNDRLEQEIKKAKRYKSNTTLLLVGLDRFRELNELHGRDTCDRILAETAVLLTQSVREVDTVARFSGDEFAVLLPETGIESAVHVARRIIASVKEYPFLNGRTGLAVSVSVGIAPWDITLHSAKELIDAAHRAMLQAKRRGGDSFCTVKEAEAEQFLILKEDTNLIEEIKQEIALLSEDFRKSYFQSTMKLFEDIPYFKKFLVSHLERVAFFSEKLASKIGLNHEEIQTIRRAGLLHDIGKVAIDERILLKSGRLAANEIALIRRHPVIAAQMLGEMLFLKNELPIILHHHERFSGGGYPDRINGNHIPLGARVIAITEAWDTMITSQPYRDALTLDHALDELKKCAATQFDPELTKEFTKLVSGDSSSCIQK